MKHFNTISILLIFALLWSNCSSDFEEINTNPNAPTEVEPSLLLRQIIYDYGEAMSYEGFVAGNLLGQYFTAIDFNLFDRHSLTEPQFGGNPWPIFYQNLRDNEILLAQSIQDPIAQAYQAPALIMKAYMTAALTDIYGDVPYSEALQGQEGVIAPVYDTQEDIYLGENGILANLRKAILLIDENNSVFPITGDLLFEGNLEGWKRMANSLLIKYLMRISDRVDVSLELQTIFEAGNFMGINGQNAQFNFSPGPPNYFRMAALRDGDFNLFILSKTMQTLLEKLDDPRRDIFFRGIANDPSGETFHGLLNGPDASQTSISVSDYSLTGTIFRENTGDLKANFITAWETKFFLAEAAQKGWINANPKDLYEEGVQLAFEYWNTEMPIDYLISGNAAYKWEGANPLEQILQQKWLGNIINGYEGWIEYKRTGFPVFNTIAASLNNDLIPVRLPYPADEAALNSHNFKSATETNNNSINARVWWDVD